MNDDHQFYQHESTMIQHDPSFNKTGDLKPQKSQLEMVKDIVNIILFTVNYQ